LVVSRCLTKGRVQMRKLAIASLVSLSLAVNPVQAEPVKPKEAFIGLDTALLLIGGFIIGMVTKIQVDKAFSAKLLKEHCEITGHREITCTTDFEQDGMGCTFFNEDGIDKMRCDVPDSIIEKLDE